MAYGFKSRRKSAASSYRRRRFSVRRATKKFTALSKRRSGLRFATVGFSRNVEKKYWDKTYQANCLETLTGQTAVTNFAANGVTYVSNLWGDYTFGETQSSATAVSNDMLKGVPTGTTARTRIGNKINPRYLKGAFTFNAATYIAQSNSYAGQGGETEPYRSDDYAQPYLRTTYRFVIVKDLQVNSTDVNVTWPQVFDTTGQQAGVHSELNVDNMGRFVVLQDKLFTLDADQPQKTIPFMISGKKIGSVRYNGPSGTALTDRGIYIIYAAFVYGWRKQSTGDALVADNFKLSSPVGHSRLCFTDD